MKNNMSNLIQNFFEVYLPTERGLSEHTILSYRDTIKLFLKNLTKNTGKKITKINLKDFNAKSVLSFLESIEQNGNAIKTRNQRLAVLKSLYLYLMNMDPERINQYEKIFHIKSKRGVIKPVEYLTKTEVEEILSSIKNDTKKSHRNYLILLFLYNTGARVQELCDLKVSHLRLEKPYLVHLHGKGRKVRQVPLWEETVKKLKDITLMKELNDYVFENRNNQQMSRFGIRYILNCLVLDASVNCKSLKDKKITPHIIRHTTAMHLLQSGVDITIIKAWLGHVDLKTTHGYIEIDLQMKEKALNQNKTRIENKSFKKLLNKNSDIIKWLESI